MSSISTLSKFFYGATITHKNNLLDFSDLNGPLVAIIELGSYSATELAREIERALNISGGLVYEVTFNRSTGFLTISATGVFSLLLDTGLNKQRSLYPLIGFTDDEDDLAGLSAYVSDVHFLNFYRPQYLLNKYLKPSHIKKQENATYSVTATGNIQAAFFGESERVEMDLIVITDRTGMWLKPFYENSSGIIDFLTFADHIIRKNYVEFMEDVSKPNDYVTLFLEKTEDDSNGFEIKIENMSKDVYRSKLLTFRVIKERL